MRKQRVGAAQGAVREPLQPTMSREAPREAVFIDGTVQLNVRMAGREISSRVELTLRERSAGGEVVRTGYAPYKELVCNVQTVFLSTDREGQFFLYDARITEPGQPERRVDHPLITLTNRLAKKLHCFLTAT